MANKKTKKATKTKKPAVAARLKEKRFVNEGRIYINATFNNTIVTITDLDGNVVDWVSSGKLGFKGTRKSTPFAAISTIEEGVGKAVSRGLKRAELFIKGPGPGREAALKVLRGKREIDIATISDITPIPHNGPRPPKMRRG
jgi:small subunit ribosomal protein S11